VELPVRRTCCAPVEFGLHAALADDVIEIDSRSDDADVATTATRLEDYPNVVAQEDQAAKQAIRRESGELPPHESGDLWLIDAEASGSFRLGHAVFRNQLANLSRELRLCEPLLGIRKAEIGVNVVAAFGDGGFPAFHGDFSFIRVLAGGLALWCC
jgi:hypothetical protein